VGQYFLLANLDRREYIDPHKIGGALKLWEWCANDFCRLLPFLLRQSDSLGGGDLHDPEGYEYAGRWAGDRIVLVGDYDSSGLYHEVRESYTDISVDAAIEFNTFMGDVDLMIEVERGGPCSSGFCSRCGKLVSHYETLHRSFDVCGCSARARRGLYTRPDIVIGVRR